MPLIELLELLSVFRLGVPSYSLVKIISEIVIGALSIVKLFDSVYPSHVTSPVTLIVA